MFKIRNLATIVIAACTALPHLAIAANSKSLFEDDSVIARCTVAANISAHMVDERDSTSGGPNEFIDQMSQRYLADDGPSFVIKTYEYAIYFVAGHPAIFSSDHQENWKSNVYQRAFDFCTDLGEY